MKLDWNLMLNVIIALLVYNLLDKLFLGDLLDKVGGSLEEVIA
jgi:hypothetical protein